MRYSVDVDINAPRDQVLEVFLDTARLHDWQPDLLRWEMIQGEDPNAPGAQMRQIHRMGKSEIDMVQTIVENRAPDFLAATYEADGVWNIVENSFSDRGDTTHWRIDTEFKCDGLMIRLMTIFAPWMFRRNTKSAMMRFKTLVET